MTDYLPYALLFCGIFLLVLSIIDVLTYKSKKGGIPAVMTTSLLIVMFLAGDFKSGLLAGLLSLLFTELDLWGGLADFKVFVASAMLFNPIGVLIYACLLCVLAIGSKFVIRILNKKATKMPFIPVITIAFILNIILTII